MHLTLTKINRIHPTANLHTKFEFNRIRPIMFTHIFSKNAQFYNKFQAIKSEKKTFFIKILPGCFLLHIVVNSLFFLKKIYNGHWRNNTAYLNWDGIDGNSNLISQKQRKSFVWTARLFSIILCIEMTKKILSLPI